MKILSQNAVDIIAFQMKLLPPLPSVIRYLDGYSDTYWSIRDPEGSDDWTVHFNGAKETLTFSKFDPTIRSLLKRTFAWAFSQFAPSTIAVRFNGLKSLVDELGTGPLKAPFELSPNELNKYWHNYLFDHFSVSSARADGMKIFLLYLCEFSLGCLSPGYRDFIGAFRYPKVDHHAAVRRGDCFLNEEEEVAIVNYLDDLSAETKNHAVDPMEIRKGCVLIASYQYAMRPIQIAKVTLEDLIIRLPNVKTANGPIVHLRFFREKQRVEREKVPLLRKIKREWAILYKQFAAFRCATPDLFLEEGAVLDSFFGLSPATVSDLIPQITKQLTGVKRSTTDLRHTAAQRLADAGASHEELAEFLGHSHLSTGLVYFTNSATQAERLNRALATSAIYSEIVRVHRTKMIDKAALAHLPQENQIGGVPHGIPIAGIGACQLGQSLCTKNPVLSCYGCRKFLPVRDIAVHEEVRNSLRPVVRMFYDASRGETESPAYTQLRRTIGAVERTIGEIGGDTDAAE